MLNWRVWVGVAALATSMGVSAQSGQSLLKLLGHGLGNAPKAAAQEVRPAGTDWDLGGEQLGGAEHLRIGFTSTADEEAPTCDLALLSMAYSSYKIDASDRQHCLWEEWSIDVKAHGSNGITYQMTDAIERKYGPAFDARKEKFKTIRRYAFRPDFNSWGGVEYNHERGVLDIFIPFPSADQFFMVGKNFVPRFMSDAHATWAPKWAGRYHLALRMSEQDYQDFMREGMDSKNNLIVFNVDQITLPNGPLSPNIEITVERVNVGFKKEVLEVDLTKPKREHRG